jgi:glucokinase
MLIPTIDFGGTVIKVGLVRDGRVIASSSMPARSEQGLAPQLPRVVAGIEKLLAQNQLRLADCAGVGVSFPGLIDPQRVRITSTPAQKYDDAKEIDLVTWAQEKLGLSLRLENDAHAALLGEWQFGAGRGCDDLVVITLGTGIGTSALIRGQLLRGRHHQAGVLGGHFIVTPNGRRCGCGARGCVETESSSRHLGEIAREDPAFVSSAISKEPAIDFAAVFRLAAAGDALAGKLRDRSMDYWGATVVNLIHAFDPERVVIGGGIIRSADVIVPHLQRFVNDNAWTPWGKVKVVAAELGDDAGLLGLSALFSAPLRYV